MRLALALVTALAPFALASPAASAESAAESAGVDDPSAYGRLNPEELSMSRVLDNVRAGRPSMTDCAAGYLMTKSGRHDPARETFSTCARLGYSQASTWMSYMDQNGFGGPFDPEAATAWDRKAAEAGDPVGMFNYGVSQLRGFGVEKNEEAGRKLIDRAASAGMSAARRLQGADYDLDEVTPDADNWRYAPGF